MLSILIPTYNYDVTELVNTLHQQCLQAKLTFEILVLDDASHNENTKSSNSTINSLDYCLYAENTKNKGRTATRNRLAEKANYNWLLFLDADVIPKYKDFIERFISKKKQADLIFGGITYSETKPEPNKMLRWKYGHERESLTVAQRNKETYLAVNSGCFFIKKNIFLPISEKINFNEYGVDNLFKQFLEEKQVTILHIDNPVYHLGLEDNKTFVNKALKAVETTVLFEQKKIMSAERPLQKAYLKLKKYHLTKPFCWGIAFFEKPIQKNFTSANPSLFLFDLYRLKHYAKLKNNA
jgi:glycosyltransferase involved in cell wall biosynthesis|tara:strand:+ start:32 stop:919 length:888 start_codon:yes stop_codon:yes gene_type:complete